MFLLVVQDERHSDANTIWPLGIVRVLAISFMLSTELSLHESTERIYIAIVLPSRSLAMSYLGSIVTMASAGGVSYPNLCCQMFFCFLKDFSGQNYTQYMKSVHA